MSNTKQITEALKDLILNDDRAFVAMLSGEWGIGKTYFWKDIFVPNYLKDKNVVYISLFGKNSLSDIEDEIITRLSKYKNFSKKYKEHFNTISGWLSKYFSIPFNVSAGTLLSLFEPKDFRNIVICFDDFERLSEKVSLKDVMGLISQFKEQKECKVIMILNEKELDNLDAIDGKKHADIFALYKEKIVDYNFHYNPSQEEIFRAISHNIEKIKFCNHETIYGFFRTIDLKNIRIMKQALYLLEHFSFIGDEGYDKVVIDEFVEIALNLFVFKAKSNYSYSEFNDFKLYTPEKATKALMKDMDLEIDEENDIKINKHHEKNYKYYSRDKDGYFHKEYKSTNKDILEQNVYTFLDTHVLLEDKLKKALKENNQRLDWYDERNEISQIYIRLWTDFSIKNTEIAKQLFEALGKYKNNMYRLFHYSNYKPFIEYINKFAPKISTKDIEKEIARNYLLFYINNPDYDKYGPLENDSGTDLIISHYKWAESYKNEQKSKLLVGNTSYVLALIEEALKSKYLSEDTSFILSQISTDKYKNLIKENPDFIQPLVKFLKMPDSKAARKNIIDALNSLKDESDDYAWKVEQIINSANIKIGEEK